MANKTQEELNLMGALISTGILIPLESSSADSEVTVLCRLTKGRESVWLTAVQELLETADQAGFKAHICKLFMHRNGKLCSAWNISLRGHDQDSTIQAVGIVSNILEQWKPSLMDEEEPQATAPDRIPYNELPAELPRPAPRQQRPAAQPRPRTDQEAMQQIMQGGRRPTPHSPQGLIPLGGRQDPAEQEFTATHTEYTRDDGRVVIIDEVPLPHVGADFNRPSQPTWSEEHGKFVGGGKGAKNVG